MVLTDFLRLVKGFVLFIGPSEAGKTSILRRLVTGNFEEHEPTIGFREENVAKVRVLEIGGQESFRKYWKNALDQKPVKIFFVIDISQERDLTEFQRFCQDFPTVINRTVLTANKYDLVREVPSYIKEIDSYVICSAKENDGMLDILESIASMKEKAESKRFLSDDSKIVEKETIEDKAESIIKEFQDKF
ncbi:MAG: ADP-ribosylation factor-like protein [Candidatus Hodarchaeales archaeon]|jgi:GTPase SAR1 family protein